MQIFVGDGNEFDFGGSSFWLTLCFVHALMRSACDCLTFSTVRPKNPTKLKSKSALGTQSAHLSYTKLIVILQKWTIHRGIRRKSGSPLRAGVPPDENTSQVAQITMAKIIVEQVLFFIHLFPLLRICFSIQ